MGTTERRHREREAVRSRLLAVSLDLLASFPEDEVTMRLIADRAEYSPRTLYLYFADKQALLAAVVEEAFGRTREVQESDGWAQPGEPGAMRGALHALTLRHVGEALDQPRLYEAIFHHLWRPGVVPGPQQRAVEGRVAALLGRLGVEATVAALAPALLRTFTLTLIREGRVRSDPSVAFRTRAFTDWLLGASQPA